VVSEVAARRPGRERFNGRGISVGRQAFDRNMGGGHSISGEQGMEINLLTQGSLFFRSLPRVRPRSCVVLSKRILNRFSGSLSPANRPPIEPRFRAPWNQALRSSMAPAGCRPLRHLGDSRQQVVVSRGNPGARLMVIGGPRRPGRCQRQKALRGRSGKLLRSDAGERCRLTPNRDAYSATS